VRVPGSEDGSPGQKIFGEDEICDAAGLTMRCLTLEDAETSLADAEWLFGIVQDAQDHAVAALLDEGLSWETIGDFIDLDAETAESRFSGRIIAHRAECPVCAGTPEPEQS
jgi:hypothetical protein